MAEKVAMINVELDKPCRECGKMGACQNGLCMTCTGKHITGKLQWKIGDKTMKACIDTLQSLLWEHHAEINRAYTLNPGELVINLKLKIGITDRGTNEVEGGIAFVIEKLKDDTDAVTVDEKQEDLFR